MSDTQKSIKDPVKGKGGEEEEGEGEVIFQLTLCVIVTCDWMKEGSL